MLQCAFLTMRDTAGFVVDDDLARDPLRTLGWAVHWTPWSDPEADWGQFDLVVIRTPWDYQNHPSQFLQVLEQIERSGARLQNPLNLVRWNLNKHYLQDLQRRGIRVVPTLWHERLEADQWDGLFAATGSDEIIIKPQVGANADGVLRLTQGQSARALAEYGAKPYMVQPFVPGVVTEGEYSLIYFNGRFSHAIRKTPAAADFRVQEEHGAEISAVVAEASLRQVGDRLASLIEPTPLYLRADLIRAPAPDHWWLMELELIEPSLYLRMDPDAAGRFARAIHSCAADSRAR